MFSGPTLHRSPGRTGPLIALLLSLTLGAVGPGARAQDPPPPPDAASAGDETASADSEAPEALQEGEPILEDYEASEQISEDLSVAFPVDI